MERISKSNAVDNTLTTKDVITFIRNYKDDFNKLYNTSDSIIRVNVDRKENTDVKADDKLLFNKRDKFTNIIGSLKIFLNNVNLVRYGNLHTIDKKNLSFYSSLLVLLFPDFIKLNVDQQKKNINEFYKIICNNSKGTKKDIRNDLLKCILTKPAIKYIADYLCVNIFIIDGKTLYYSGNEQIVFFKKNIFINKINDDTYEPLMDDDNLYFTHEHILIENLMNNLSNIVPLNKSNKKTKMSIITEDLNPYLEIYEKRKAELSEKHNLCSENMNHFSDSESEKSESESEKSESEKDSSNDEKEIVTKKKK